MGLASEYLGKTNKQIFLKSFKLLVSQISLLVDADSFICDLLLFGLGLQTSCFEETCCCFARQAALLFNEGQ